MSHASDDSASSPTLPVPEEMITTEIWEQRWQARWASGAKVHYESRPADDERSFLTGVGRTPASEFSLLARFTAEFEQGFRDLFEVGPAVTVFGSARFPESHPHYATGVRIGRLLAEAGFDVLTGGGPGLMEAANRGASEAGGNTYGLNIILPHEQKPNPYVKKTVSFNYFFIRKVLLVKYSCAFIVLPGGIGTLDELFEAAALVQCHKIGPFPVVLVGQSFWTPMLQALLTMERDGVFAKDELSFGRIVDTAEDAVESVLLGLPGEIVSQLKARKGESSGR